MEIIEVHTKRGDTLFGCLYSGGGKTCIIITNGNTGNIFDNKFLRIVGEELVKNNISFLYAHNSGAFQIIDIPSEGSTGIGNTYELFDNCEDDLEAYVSFVKNLGYERIILGGHSYGTNKVVYYLSKHQKDIDKYILLSPTDTTRWKENEGKSIKELMPVALEYQKQNKLDKLLPELFDDYCVYSAAAFLDFVNNQNSKNLPIYQEDGNFEQLQKIEIQGLYIMGSKDSFAYGDTKNHLNIINKNSKYKNNKLVVIENAGHTYRNTELELAQEIISFVKD